MLVYEPDFKECNYPGRAKTCWYLMEICGKPLPFRARSTARLPLCCFHCFCRFLREMAFRQGLWSLWLINCSLAGQPHPPDIVADGLGVERMNLWEAKKPLLGNHPSKEQNGWKRMFIPAKISEKLQADSVKPTAISLSALPGKGASSPSCPGQGPCLQHRLCSWVGSHQEMSSINDILVILLIAEGLCFQVSQLKSQLSFLMKIVP